MKEKNRGARIVEKTPVNLSSENAAAKKSAILGTLGSFFRGVQGVDLAFLFGSIATGRSHGKSDVDIGVLFNPDVPVRDIQNIREELSDALRKEVDLVALNHASPVLRMQVLKHGVLIYAAERKRFYDFFVETVNQYDDLKRVRRPCEESILKGRIYA
jgi:uncharacterized protein